MDGGLGLSIEIEAEILGWAGFDQRAPALTFQWKVVCRKWRSIYMLVRADRAVQLERLKLLAALGAPDLDVLKRLEGLPRDLLDVLAAELFERGNYHFVAWLLNTAGGRAAKTHEGPGENQIVAALADRMSTRDLRALVEQRVMTNRLAFELGRRGCPGLIEVITGLAPLELAEMRAKTGASSVGDYVEWGGRGNGQGCQDRYLTNATLTNSLLLGAARGGHLPIVQRLVEAGDLAHKQTSSCYDAFWQAVEAGRGDIPLYILKLDRRFSNDGTGWAFNGASRGLNFETLLFRSARAEDPSFFWQLVDFRAPTPEVLERLWRFFFFEVAYRSNLALAVAVLGAGTIPGAREHLLPGCVFASPEFVLGLRDRGWLDPELFLDLLQESPPCRSAEAQRQRRIIEMVLADPAFCQLLRRKNVQVERLLFNAGGATISAYARLQGVPVPVVLDLIRSALGLSEKHFCSLLLDFGEEVLSESQAALLAGSGTKLVFRDESWCLLSSGKVARFVSHQVAADWAPRPGNGCPWAHLKRK